MKQRIRGSCQRRRAVAVDDARDDIAIVVLLRLKACQHLPRQVTTPWMGHKCALKVRRRPVARVPQIPFHGAPQAQLPGHLHGELATDIAVARWWAMRNTRASTAARQCAEQVRPHLLLPADGVQARAVKRIAQIVKRAVSDVHDVPLLCRVVVCGVGGSSGLHRTIAAPAARGCFVATHRPHPRIRQRAP